MHRGKHWLGKHWLAGWVIYPIPSALWTRLNEMGWHVYLSRRCAAHGCDYVQFSAGPRHPAER
jgi:hypothetical protein